MPKLIPRKWLFFLNSINIISDFKMAFPEAQIKEFLFKQARSFPLHFPIYNENFPKHSQMVRNPLTSFDFNFSKLLN